MPISPAAASPYLSVATPSVTKPSTASAMPEAGSAAVGDQVTLSSQAKQMLASGGATKPPLQLKLADGGAAIQSFDHEKMDAVMAYHGEQRDYMRRMMTFARETLGVGKPEDGGGLMLSGEITNLIKKSAAQAGIQEPQMPPDVAAWQAAHSSSSEPEPAPSKAVQGTSMITLFLPEDKGGGQVEIFFDNKALDQLATTSADTLKGGLVDLLNGGDKGKSTNEAMQQGLFGQWMNENSAYHPEWQQSKARLAYTAPGQPAGSQPMFMIQSKDRPDYVTQHTDDLVNSVLNLLKGGAGFGSPSS